MGTYARLLWAFVNVYPHSNVLLAFELNLQLSNGCPQNIFSHENFS